MSKGISRRGLLAAGGAALGLGLTNWSLGQTASNPGKSAAGFKFCLNTSTIMGQKLTIVQQVEVAAKAGYDAIEPWIRDIEAYVKGGGSTADLKKRIADAGLSVEDGIGFAAWVVDDEEARKKGLEQAKRDMELVAQIGGKRVAAPPAGANQTPGLDLRKAAERYRALAEVGQPLGITPMVEHWGTSKNISTIGEAVFVAAESGFAGACVLADVYHMYKAGSAFTGLRLLSAQAVQMIHLNDYPADPPRAQIQDSHRVFPGDGIAPLKEILRDLRAINPQCVLSLEVFNRDYWKLDALECAKKGLEKMKAAVAASA
jgi:sugar phosphate isomerase/epimerase